MKSLVIIALITLSINCFGQAFEGKISYKKSYISKDEKITDEQLTKLIGSTQEYYIKDGNYKSTTNGIVHKWQIYINAYNRIYTKLSDSDTILWNDASINADEVVKAEIKKNVTTILDYPCDELTLTYKNGFQKFYYSSKLPVDIELFKKHTYNNWYTFLSYAKAIALETITETPQFISEEVAVEVKPEKLDSTIFTLPVGIKSKKSPYQ